VHGIPIPQGSKSARVVTGKSGKSVAVMTDGFRKKPKELKGWRYAIADEARRWLRETNTAPLTGPVAMRVTFYLPRPKSASRKVLYPATRPDLDKLVRSVFDSLQGIIYSEDSRIVDIDAKKRFAIDSAPRAEIEIGAVQ
jgi:Holliday junction resolvase RusA-like endonuclease